MSHPLLQLFIVIISTLLLGAVLSFPAYQWGVIFTTVPFHKILSQVTTLCWLLMTCLFLRYNGLLSARTIGYIKNNMAVPRAIMTGWGMGILIMGILVSVLLALGTHIPEPELVLDLRSLIGILAKAIVAGILVGVIEETLYRGMLLGGLCAMLSMPASVIVSSAIYAAVHFVKFRAVPAGEDIGWVTGLEMLPDAFFRFSDPATFDAFLSLFIFGILLALIRLKNGNIYQCIGLHAGVVMMIKIINDLTDYAPGTGFDYLINRHDHLLGYLTSSWLLVLTLVYVGYHYYNPSSRNTSKK